MKTKTNVKIYRPKDLVDGSAIGQDGKWVAIPDKYANRPICVVYGDMQMDIKNYKAQVQAYRTFRDQFWTPGSNRTQHYSLGYFKWQPDR